MSNTRNIEEYAVVFKALSNPHRLKIFMRLMACCPPGTTTMSEGDECSCVGEIGQDLGIAASTLSHHMKELRQAGLVVMKRNGQNMECWMNPAILQELSRFFSEEHGVE